ncbi:MAG: putative bifunctional diguanylate cyclase/phosphodiesterase [Pseudomonadota bacterium]
MRPPTPAERLELEAAGAAPPWHALLEGLNEAAWLVDGRELGVVALNAAALALLGLPREAVLGRPAAALLATPEDLAFWDEVRAGRAERLQSSAMLARADGSTLHVLRRVSPLPGPGGPLYLVALQDLTEQRRIEDEHETALAELRATLESTADGILVTDLAGRIRSFNRRFVQLWGLPEDLLHAGDDRAVFDWMRRSVIDAAEYQRRLASIQEAALMQARDRLLLHGGKVLERIAQPQWSRGRPIGRVYAFRDLSEQIAADQRIEQLSFTDALTGLANRRLLADRMAHALAVARRDGDPFALLMLDLDRFKQINDSLGHHLGDRVLRVVSERLRGCLREVDMIARTGGDQFAMLVHHADAHGAEVTARRVLDAASRPYMLEGAEFTVTCSIGIALCPQDGAQIDDLVRHAETAMQRAKDGGRATYRFHQAGHSVDLRSRMRLNHAMRQGLASGHFHLHYQPQVDLRDGRVIGAEALIRWRDPERGSVAPADFIPVAEDSGFIVSIGDWVLDRAVQQAARWRERGWQLPVAVNVSALQFQQAGFAERVAEALQQAGLPPQMLELELTESILVRDADEALARLNGLARIGVKLAIDDFGTGYSSLAYLKRFPIEKLKIDRSFVKGLPADDSDAGIVQAIIQMARALGLRVIAEGVETESQRHFLVRAGCHQFQGFLYAPALDSTSFEQRLQTLQ